MKKIFAAIVVVKLFTLQFKAQSFEKDFAFTFFSYLGTNHVFAPKTINRCSFNLLYGRSKGTRILELGALVNVDRGNVRYFQAAGLVNYVKDSLVGIQFAGLTNFVGDAVYGYQSAGLNNHSGSLEGIQSAGLYNYNKGNAIGIQIAGLFNYTKHIKGIQMSGLFNLADSINGLQVSGLLNSARKVKGIQLAVINISDSCKGLPIGVFSYVKHGYHRLELSAHETGFLQLGFRTGVQAFHNIFLVGGNWFTSNFLWTVGYGLGSTLKVRGPMHITTEISTQSFLRKSVTTFNFSQLNKVYVAAEYILPQKFSVALGPSFNVLHQDIRSTNYASIIQSLVPSSLYTYTNRRESLRTTLWIGASLSFKFL